jgi:hypothetical protein
MKRFTASLLITLFLVTLTASSALAQQRRQSPEQMKERMTAQIDETITGLALTGDRAETVKLLLTTQGERRIAIQAEAMASRGEAGENRRAGMTAMREQMGAIDEETLTLLKDVLSEEELVKYAEIVLAQRPGRRRGNPNTQ